MFWPKKMESKHENVALDHSAKASVIEPDLEAHSDTQEVADAVFGVANADGPNYRSLGWIKACVLCIKSQIGLGVLAIPLVFDTLGIVPGVLVILAIAVMTTWSDYVVGTFKLAHPEVYTTADVGMLIFGPIGREIFGAVYWLLLTFIAGAGMIGTSVALNAITEHGTCTVVFVVVAAVVNYMISSIRTLNKITWIGWAGLAGIIAAVLTLAIAVSQQDRPSAAPQTGPWDRDIKVVGRSTFLDGMNAVSTVIFAYAGTPNFFNIIAEMKEPRDFPKTLLVCQTFVTMVYLVIGGIVYHYCGQYVASPALGSAGPLLKKVCYGLAIPGLAAGMVLYTHIPAKYVFIRIMRNSRHLNSNSYQHWAVWLGCVFFNNAISFIVAESIPVFDNLLSLTGALFGSFLCLQAMGIMWIYDNQRRIDTLGRKLLYAWNVFLIAAGTFTMVAGTWGAAIAIRNALNTGNVTQPFSCADNSI